MSSHIRAWLNSRRDFATGARLYKEHGTDARLIIRLEQGETPTLKRELFHALKGLLQPAIVSITDKPVVCIVNNLASAPAPAASKENPASLEAKKEADLLFQEMQNTRAQLLAICPVEEGPADRDPELQKQRGRLAKAVMILQERVDDAYDDYRYALEHGQRREQVPPVTQEVDPLLLGQTITNLRKRLSKMRIAVNKDQAADKPVALQLEAIAAKEQLLATYLVQYDQAKASGRS